MAVVSITMGKFVAGLVIAILAASAISVGASTMLAAGPQGPEGSQGDTGPQGPQGPREYRDRRANRALDLKHKVTFQFQHLHSCHVTTMTMSHIYHYMD